MTEIDAIGLSCPLPVLRLQKALRGMAGGDSLRLLTSDPMAAIDVPHYLGEHGHKLLAQTDQQGSGDMQIVVFEIEKA